MKRFFRAFIFSFLFLFVITPVALADTTSTLLPFSAGNYQNWTPKSGSDHVAMVDESICNERADFNKTTTVLDRDSYSVSLSSIPDGATITQIAITPCASRNNSGSGSSTMDVFYRLNGIDSADEGAYNLPTGTTPSVLTATNFSSVSAVKSLTTTLEIGAVYSAGNKGVRLSQISTVVTYTPLSTPSGLTASATGTGSAVNLSWVDNASNEDGFIIERSDNGGAFTQVATVSANVTMYSDPGLSVGTYAYRVSAYNSGGDSGYTNIATAYILNAPYNLTATTASSASAVILNWVDSSSSEDGFKIERSDNGGAFYLIYTTTPNVQTYTNYIFSEGTFVYRVRAYKATSFSLYSNSDDAFILGAPFGLTAHFASGSGVTLNWFDNSSIEDGYTIERRVFGGAFSEIASVSANTISYLDPFFTSGSYEYRVRSYKGIEVSTYSATASATIP